MKLVKLVISCHYLFTLFVVDYLPGFDSLKTYEENRSRSLEEKADEGLGEYLINLYHLFGKIQQMTN